MHLIHIHGDILLSPLSMPIAHAVSYDGKMGAGLALQLHKTFNLRSEFRNTARQCPGIVPIWRNGRLIINCITKWNFYDKPPPSQVRLSLIALRDFMAFNNIRELAIPEISAGLDRVPLPVVINILNDVFSATPVTVYMHHL